VLTVLDIGIGNIGSVQNALRFLGFEFRIATTSAELSDASKIIFPGVGNFFTASKTLHATGMVNAIRSKVLDDKTPILGVCLGMQLLADVGYEGGQSKGLGLIEGEVVPIELEDKALTIPHMGWNTVSGNSSALFDGIGDGECYYFVHSYEVKLKDQSVCVGYTDHGRGIVATFSKDQIHGAQFHPEKSQKAGLKLLRNFVELC